MDDDEALICREGSVAPGDQGGRTSNTVTVSTCNNCTLAQVIAAAQSDPNSSVGANYKLAGPPFTNDTLVLNIIGLRVKGTVSNMFDDRMVVFYRPVDLASPTTVLDPDALKGVTPAAIEAFLQSPLAQPLKLNGTQLPGEPSVDADKKEECGVHIGWKVLRYPITTDPGWEKKPDPAKHVPVGNAENAYLAQGRASLAPGSYPASHRLGIHHYGSTTGYTAGSQDGPVSILRGYTAKYLKEKLKGCETTWEKAFAQYKKQKEKENKKKNITTPVEPTEDWVRSYLMGQIGEVAEIRDATLMGPVVGNAVSVQFTLTSATNPDPKHPGKTITTWTMTFVRLDMGGAEIDDARVVVSRTSGVFGINLHASNGNQFDPNDPKSDKRFREWNPNVYNWSEGCQVQKGMQNFKQFRALMELSKHARCPNRKTGAADPCASMTRQLLLEDVLCAHFANKEEQGEYVKKRKQKNPVEPDATFTTLTDAMLHARWVDGSLNDELLEAIQDRVDRIEFRANPPAGPVTTPTPTLSKALKSTHKADVTAQRDAHLFPAAADEKLRKGVGVSALVDKLDGYVTDDVQRDANVKAAIDARIPLLKQGAKRETALTHQSVQDAIRVAAQASRTACLAKLATELDKVAPEFADREKSTIDDIKAKRRTTTQNWTNEGFQLCDFLWQCTFRVSYTLAEVDKAFVDEVDKRPP